jgi:ankyrin repeat protein
MKTGLISLHFLISDYKMSRELFNACKIGNVGKVQACLARGENVNSRNDSDGSLTPLLIASQGNQLEIVQLLLSRADLDIGATNTSGNTALHTACYHGYVDCVVLLGQDSRMTSKIINMKNNLDGETALMVAVNGGHLSCVERMAEMDGFEWRIRTKEGETLEDISR